MAVTADGASVADKARLPREVIARGATVAATPSAALGRQLDPAAYLMHRAWVKTMVLLVLDDPDDPTPCWLVSTRHPIRVAALNIDDAAAASHGTDGSRPAVLLRRSHAHHRRCRSGVRAGCDGETKAARAGELVGLFGTETRTDSSSPDRSAPLERFGGRRRRRTRTASLRRAFSSSSNPRCLRFRFDVGRRSQQPLP